MLRDAPLPAAALSARRAASGARVRAARPLRRTPARAVQHEGACADAMKASRWKNAFQLLTEKQVKGVSAKEAKDLMSWPRSFVLVDVRRADQFAAYHATGSRNVPLYRLIDVKSGSLLQLLRALAFQAQNVDPVEDSPDFVDALRAATAGARGVLFTDGEGGSLEATPVRPLGQVSRALIAAYVLLSETGYKGTVVHLNGGLNAWFAAGQPGEGEEAAWVFTGKTPAAAQFRAAQAKQQ